MTATTAVMTADRRFFDALVAADAAALDDVLDPQFLIVDVNAGDVTSRSDFIAFVASGAVQFQRIDTFPDEAIVRQFGECAVVVGRTAMRFAMPHGATVEVGSRYTHLYVAAAGEQPWRLASAQGTRVPDA